MRRNTTNGVKVLGSAALHVDPDSALVQFSVSRQAKQPRDAFRETNLAVRAVRAFLSQARVTDLAASRITLSRAFEFNNGNKQPSGYLAKVSISLLLTELDRMEDILAGVIDAGADEIGSIEFRTSKLKEYRAEARRRAVAAAREKADLYCAAAAVTLGDVVSLEDLNPNAPHGSGQQNTTNMVADDAVLDRALSPGSIVVSAAVSIVYDLEIEFDATKIPF
jgi:uncharacterized protein YggE